MSLQHFYQDPFEAFERRLQNLVGGSDNSLGNQVRSVLSSSHTGTKMDVYETETDTVIHAELPGFKKEDISIDISEESNCLTLKGTNKRSESFNEGQLRFSERSYGSFTRTIRLPNNSQFDKVGAKFNDGIIEITIPKCAAKASRQISIE